MSENFVPYPPSGFVIALQYWAGDESEAMRLARLIADIEREKRRDVIFAFCPRWDLDTSELVADTWIQVAEKFVVLCVRASARQGVGHPAGANDLWSNTVEDLSTRWAAGTLDASGIFTIEADGAPLCRNWIDRLRHAHQAALCDGKRVLGAWTEQGGDAGAIPHFNGSLVVHPSMWLDRPSMHRTPPAQAWDVFHAAALMQEGRATPLIKNIYGSRDWSDGALTSLSKETAWLASTKDDSAIAWAEQTLRAGAPPKFCDRCGRRPRLEGFTWCIPCVHWQKGGPDPIAADGSDAT